MVAAALAVSASAARAALYDEAVSGDLSSVYTAPSFLQLDTANAGPSAGLFGNVISGTVGRNGAVLDRDYLTINVPQGYLLVELRVGNQVTVGSNGSFLGLSAGTAMPNPDTAVDASGLLGYRIYSPADATTDILDDMSVPLNGSSGFARPLGPGNYTLWIQELNAGTYRYRFNALITPVPAPSALGTTLLGALLIALGFARRSSGRA
jgi:hypothetical protein